MECEKYYLNEFLLRTFIFIPLGAAACQSAEFFGSSAAARPSS